MSTSTDALLYDVIRHIRPLHRNLAKAVESQLRGTGVSVGLRAALERLAEEGPLTVPQIARSVLVGRQFIQRMIDDGLKAGLVKTEDNPDHRRSRLLQITPSGRKVLEQIRLREQRLLAQVGKQMRQSDVEACVRVIRTLSESFVRIVREDAQDG